MSDMDAQDSPDAVRQALFERVARIAERNPGVADREVERVLKEIDAELEATDAGCQDTS